MKRLMTSPRIKLGHEQLVVMPMPPTLLGGVAAPLNSMMGVPAYPGWEVPSRTTGQPSPGRPKLPVVMVCDPEPMAKSMVVVVASPGRPPQLKLACWTAARKVQVPAFVLHRKSPPVLSKSSAVESTT